MIDCNNKQQKFFYGIQSFKSNCMKRNQILFSPEDTTHRTTACNACGASNKALMYYFSIRTRILQRNLVKLSNPTRVLPKFFLQNPQKRIEFHKPRFFIAQYKCLYFLSNILMQHTLFKESDSIRASR